MNLEELKRKLSDQAIKDIKINLENVLSNEFSKDLSTSQILNIALASAYASRNKELVQAFISNSNFNDAELFLAKAATAIMSMNNIYYRFTHTVSEVYAAMPAKLRMQVLAMPDVDKITLELNSLAVSAINGCGKCMIAHTEQLEKAGVSKSSIQSSIRIAAVVHAIAVALEIQ